MKSFYKIIIRSLDRDLISFLDNLSFLVVISDATVWIFCVKILNFVSLKY